MPIKKYILLAMISIPLCLGGCRLVYKPDIKQGNIITIKQLQKLHPGMTKAEVINILGNPVLINLFNKDQLIYVYTLQPGHAPFQKQQLRVYFSDGLLTHFTTDVH